MPLTNSIAELLDGVPDAKSRYAIRRVLDTMATDTQSVTNAAAASRPITVGTRMCYLGVASDGVAAGMNTRFQEVLSQKGPLQSIQLIYTNFGNVAGTSTEANPTASKTITSSIERNFAYAVGTAWNITDAGAVPLQVTFGGNASVTIPAGKFVLSDPIIGPFSAGECIYINTFDSTSAVAVMPVGKYNSPTLFEYCDSGYFFTTISFASNTTWSFTLSSTALNGANLPLKPGTVKVFAGTLTGSIFDDGVGGFPTGNGLAAGSTINYTTGAIVLNFSVASTVFNIAGYGKNGAALTDDTMNRPRANTNGLNNLGLTFGFAGYSISGIVGKLTNGTSVKPFSFTKVGDSIMWGAGNYSVTGGQTADTGTSWADYSIAGSAGVLSLAQSGEKLSQFASFATRYRRMNLTLGALDRVLLGYGSNDIAASASLSTMQANFLTITGVLAQLLPNGIYGIYASTIIPRTVSAVSQTPLNSGFGPGTVASGSPSTKNAWNAWLYTQVGVTIGGVIDLCAIFEAVPGSQAGSGNGQWSSLTYTADGTHPNQTGNRLVASTIGINSSAPHPAFVIP